MNRILHLALHVAHVVLLFAVPVMFAPTPSGDDGSANNRELPVDGRGGNHRSQSCATMLTIDRHFEIRTCDATELCPWTDTGGVVF